MGILTHECKGIKNDKIKEVVENEDIRHGLYKEYGIQ